MIGHLSIFEDKKPTVKFFLLECGKMKLDEYHIYVRITYNRQKTELSVRLAVKECDWDFKEEMFYPTTNYNAHCNQRLLSIRNEIQSIFLELKKGRMEPTVKMIRTSLKGAGNVTSETLLLSFFDQSVETKRQQTREFTSGTIKQYHRCRNHLANFLIKKQWSDIKLSELSRNFIVQFEDYLLSNVIKSIKRPMKRSSANTCLKRLKTEVNDAVKQEIIPTNPFLGYSLKREKNHIIVYLTEQELEAIKNCDLSKRPVLEKVRDFCLVQAYTGLRYSDLSSLKSTDVQYGEAGEVWINKIMIKTQDVVNFPMLTLAVDILKKYQSECENSGYLLPRLSNQNITRQV